MRKYFFPAMITCFLIIAHIGVTDMKALTDKELNSVTGQAGIVGFNQVFSYSSAADQEIQKKVFDQVFVKSDMDATPVNPNQTSFEEAFVNKLALDFTEGIEQKMNLNIHMEEITFAQAFTKMAGVDMDKTVLNDMKMENLNIKVRGDVKIKFN
ncbi:MAG: hypothetical protein KJ737_14265 [Proteobacteria bacterium]|nr:hypothetical protein [Pseudomonadota bacterium]